MFCNFDNLKINVTVSYTFRNQNGKNLFLIKLVNPLSLITKLIFTVDLTPDFRIGKC
jgi:hypothetical protein